MNLEERKALQVGDLVRFQVKNDHKFDWDGVPKDYDIGLVVEKEWQAAEADYTIKIEWVSNDPDSVWYMEEDEEEWVCVSKIQ